MPEPQILRRTPIGKVVETSRPIPVIAEIWWEGGGVDDVPAIVDAWTADAVRITWEDREGLRTDWIPAEKVHRSARSPHSPRSDPPQRNIKKRYGK